MQMRRSVVFCVPALSHEDQREFTRVFRLWATFQNLEDSTAMAAFALLLHDKAIV